MNINYEDLTFSFGDRRLVGQQFAREHLERIVRSGRISHAYLFSGPSGIGKTAFALAFAEILNGIDNLTDLDGQAFSKKSSWFPHPDIHLFLPLPTSVVSNNNVAQELRPRLELLNKDPYEIVNFRVRPSLTDDESSKNLRAFYPIDYFREEIRPKAFLKPNEGRKTVIILPNIEEMRTEAANAFLKLLEEPSEDLVFILTTENMEALLPTIISRCQQIRLSPLKTNEIAQALINYDGVPEKDASYLSRISGGNYAMTRFYDANALKSTREAIIQYLRNSYVQNAVQIIDTAQQWQSENNIEGQIAILNILEIFIRDLMVYRETQNRSLLTNYDQVEVIESFCTKLQEARLEEMIEQVNRCKPMVYQYVQPKLIYTTLSLRFANLMRGLDPAISGEESWKHLPAFSD
ncbi:AAA family ATPase [Aliifodinibius sp. S!AR15-10]|uniref:DNA polymerase III subunit n=1 Tax=Aliifodinibius sp. S!AR15-10 TaxID=2950437 RepID=UPI00285A21E3|nr:DNA polymerase III subunit delta' C-terminal domain-containing protein [Aliifodinibius sp. S!AR15-10]MDR8390396.1 AAA family ATPase [Aliifodinibius sp. S!AR15-10]